MKDNWKNYTLMDPATPVEIALLYAVGLKDRAQFNARSRHYNVTVGAPDGEVSDNELRRVREAFDSAEELAEGRR